MKRLLALFICLLFIGQMFALQSSPSPTCGAQTVHACACCCGHMKCCAAMPKPGSQLPSIPPRTASQNQFLALVVTSLAQNQPPMTTARPNFSISHFPPAAGAIPIFQRDCAILI